MGSPILLDSGSYNICHVSTLTVATLHVLLLTPSVKEIWQISHFKSCAGVSVLIFAKPSMSIYTAGVDSSPSATPAEEKHWLELIRWIGGNCLMKRNEKGCWANCNCWSQSGPIRFFLPLGQQVLSTQRHVHCLLLLLPSGGYFNIHLSVPSFKMFQFEQGLFGVYVSSAQSQLFFFHPRNIYMWAKQKGTFECQ